MWKMWTFLQKVKNVDLFANYWGPKARTQVPNTQSHSRGYGAWPPRKFWNIKGCMCILSVLGDGNWMIFNKKISHFSNFDTKKGGVFGNFWRSMTTFAGGQVHLYYEHSLSMFNFGLFGFIFTPKRVLKTIQKSARQRQSTVSRELIVRKCKSKSQLNLICLGRLDLIF